MHRFSIILLYLLLSTLYLYLIIKKGISDTRRIPTLHTTSYLHVYVAPCMEVTNHHDELILMRSLYLCNFCFFLIMMSESILLVIQKSESESGHLKRASLKGKVE